MSDSHRFTRALRCAVLAALLAASAPAPARAQGTYVQGDLGSFVSFVCGNLPSSNLAQVLQEALNQLTGLQTLLGQVGVQGGGLIGDPSQCLPGFSLGELPAIPGIGELASCLDFSGFGSIGSGIASCLGDAFSGFPDLSEYFSQFQWDFSQITQCLQGMVSIPTISMPDFLAQLQQTLNNLISILSSAQINFPVYDGFFNFFIDFCQHQYSQGGGMVSSAGSGSYSSTVAVSGGSLLVSTTPIGAFQTAAAAVSPSQVYALIKGPSGKKKYSLPLHGAQYRRSVRLTRKGTYSVSVYVMQGAVPAVVTMAKVKY